MPYKTISVDPEVQRKAKLQATMEQRSLRALVESLILEYIAKQQGQQPC